MPSGSLPSRRRALAALMLCVCLGRSERGRAAAPAERLVTVGGPVTETVFALGRGDAVVGTDTSSVYPVAETARLPKVGYQRTIAAEGVLALRPTRVLAAEEAGPPSALAQLRDAGIPVEVLPSTPTLAGARAKIRRIAELLGVPARGEKLVAQLDADVAAAAKLPTRPGPPLRVLFIYARGGGTMQVAGAGTQAAEMIRLAGADNAAGALTGYRPLSAEALLGALPDVILMPERGAASIGGAEGIGALPGLSTLPRERRPRVVTLDDLMLMGFGPRTGLAVRALRERFYAPAAAPASAPASGRP